MRNLKHRSRSVNRRVRKLLQETYDSKKDIATFDN